jgi:hypothetical protein
MQAPVASQAVAPHSGSFPQALAQQFSPPPSPGAPQIPEAQVASDAQGAPAGAPVFVPPVLVPLAVLDELQALAKSAAPMSPPQVRMRES